MITNNIYEKMVESEIRDLRKKIIYDSRDLSANISSIDIEDIKKAFTVLIKAIGLLELERNKKGNNKNSNKGKERAKLELQKISDIQIQKISDNTVPACCIVLTSTLIKSFDKETMKKSMTFNEMVELLQKSIKGFDFLTQEAFNSLTRDVVREYVRDILIKRKSLLRRMLFGGITYDEEVIEGLKHMLSKETKGKCARVVFNEIAEAVVFVIADSPEV